MAKFSEVFATTGKVIAALFIIAVGAAVIYGVVHSAVSSTSLSKTEAETSSALNKYDEAADNMHTTMPKSKWDAGIRAAIKQHCAVEGMTKEEVEQALGKATETTNYGATSKIGDSWTYTKIERGKCLKYDGDNCAEYQHDTDIVFFSPNGHKTLGYTGAGCLKSPFFTKYEAFLVTK